MNFHKRNAILFLFAISLTTLFCSGLSHANGTTYDGLNCSRWHFDSDGGFEGGEDIASTSCAAVGNTEIEVDLSVGCWESGFAIRFIAPSNTGESGRIAFEFADRPLSITSIREVRRFRYEDADGAAATYVSFPDPIIFYLRKYKLVRISLEDWQDDLSVGLKGSKAAIGRVLAECGALEPEVVGPLVVDPVDEGSNEFPDAKESFESFREKLLAGAKARDPSFMFSRLDRNIKVTFGGDDRPDEFKSLFTMTSDHQSEEATLIHSAFVEANWRELEQILQGGGLYGIGDGQRVFFAPYQYAALWEMPEYLEKRYPAYESGFIIESDVPVLNEASLDSSVLRRVTHEAINISDSIDDEYGVPKFYKVALWDRTEGYVEARHVRHFLDRRATFVENERGEWTITRYIGGD